jgi:glutathione S-transferase
LVRQDIDYEFIGSKNSYYSAKVRACLQYKRIPYSERTANIESMMRVKELTGDHVYPVVVCPDGTVLRDSCTIVEELEARHPTRPVLPEDPLQRLIATLIETVADEFMLSTTIGLRWYAKDTSEWAKDMFVQISTERVTDKLTRERGATNGGRIANSIQKRTQHIAEKHFESGKEATKEICDRLDDHLRETPFLLGDRPSLADLGMMNAMFGHLYRDPGEVCDHIHWKCISLSLWIDHMLSAAGESDQGSLYIAPSIKPLLASFKLPYGAAAEQSLELAEAALAQPSVGQAIDIRPRGPLYTGWKIQRLMDLYRTIEDAQRDEADALLEAAGFLDVCRHEADWRIELASGVLRVKQVTT